MSREYSSKHSASKGKNASGQLLLVLVTFLLGYCSASFLDVKTVSDWVNKQWANNHAPISSHLVQASTHSNSLPPKPKFEFYTLLANEKGIGAQGGNAHGTNKNTSSAKIDTSTIQTASVTSASALSSKNPIASVSQEKKGNFLIQVASFKAKSDAEHMKGLLILKGFDVNVVPIVTADRGSWYRVVVGPYSTRGLAQQAQLTLAKKERLNGMIRSGG